MEKLNLLNYQKIEFTKLNDQFSVAKCYVLALGKNRNRTYFAKENVDKAYSTLNFIPVVGHVLEDDNGNYYLGGHDVKVDLSNGFKLKSLCIPYGVAIPSLEPTYEEVTEEDGTLATYLTTNIVLWTGRYPELEKTFYNENVFCGQSMEILYSNAKQLEEDEDYLDVIDFSFDALCMLGKSDDSRFNVEPCFPNAKIESVFNLDKQVFDDFKKDLIAQFGSLEELRFQKKGGEDMDELKNLLAEFNLTEEQLDFSIEGLSIDELREKLTEFTNKDKPKDPKVELEESKFTTYNEKKESLYKLFQSSIERDTTGKVVKEVYYYLMDFDDNFAYMSIDTWKLDEEYTTEHYRYPYKFDEDGNATLNGEREKLYRAWLTEEERRLIEDSKAEFEAYKESHSHSDEEFNVLSQYKTNKEKEEFDCKISRIVENFEDIVDKEEFKELYKKKDEYTSELFEKECIYIRGLYAKKVKKFSAKKENLIKMSLENIIDDVDSNDKSYLYEKYLNK